MMMPNPGDIPIMEYVRTLEGKIRKYQKEGARISWRLFWSGFALGSVVVSTAWLLLSRKG